MATCSGQEQTADTLSDLMKNINISSDSIGSTHWIEVTHINNPNSFYVRPTSYNKYLNILQECGPKLNPDEIYLGVVIIFKSKVNKSFIRGQIIYIDGEGQDVTLELFAMDYGYLERDIPLSEIYKPQNINNAPSLVKHCQLELCKPIGGTWNDNSIDAMKFYVGNERTKIVIRNKADDLLTVTMFNSCPEDISTMLALQGYSTFGYEYNSINRFSVAPRPKQAFYLFQEFKVHDCVQVRVQSGTSLKEFYVAEGNNYKKYIQERENIAYFARQANVIEPEDIYEGRPVCVPTTKRYSYERALIKKIIESYPENKVLVQLVDWGDLMEVSVTKVKPIRESFLASPAVAIFCTADESQIWDNSLQKFLYPGYAFVIKIKSIGDSFKTPNIVNIFELTKCK